MTVTTTLIIAALITIILVLFLLRSKKSKIVQTTVQEKPQINYEKLNSAVEDFGILLNGVPKRISSSPKINSITLNSLEQDKIKEILAKMQENGEFEEELTDYILSNGDDVSSLSYQIFELAKDSLNLPNHRLAKVEEKESYILSDIEEYISNEILHTTLFKQMSGKELQTKILTMINSAKKSMLQV